MIWRAFETSWRSLYWDHQLPTDQLPLDFVTPDEAWDYGAITASLTPGADELILKVRATAFAGRIGLSISKTNGSALLSEERVLTSDQKAQSFYFRLSPGQTSVSLLVRNYDDDGRLGAVRVESVEAALAVEVDPAILSQVAGPYAGE
jgi:hypothetical protein